MSDKTVKQLADIVKIPLDRLLVQLKEAGLTANKADDIISEAEKAQLLVHLRKRHGKAEEEALRRVALERRKVTEIKQAKPSGSTNKTIKVRTPLIKIDLPNSISLEPPKAILTNSVIDDIKISEINNELLEGEDSLNNHILSTTDNIGQYPHVVIKLTKEQFSIFELKRRYDKTPKTLIMNPDFQRNDVWNSKQKSELIESILMGIPIPIIYLFENTKGEKQVVDGRQRLSTIFDYLDNKFLLTELNILKTETGNKFKDLNTQLQSKIEDYQIQSYTIQPPTPEKVKFDIFDRVNRGGTRLNNQEMRNALYLGNATSLLETLSTSQYFLNATGKGLSPKRMKDKYVILRFIGFYLLKNKLIDTQYKSDIDEFLAEVMEFINKSNNELLDDLINKFKLSMNNCYYILGEDAFRFNSSKESRRPINMVLFETISYILSIELPKTINIDKLKKELENFKKIMEDRNKLGSVDTTKSVDYRFFQADKVRERLQNA
ncbi:MAG: translation initiation factor IF-2 N-terminal domain-containing protein [Methylococcaceae bacterium]